VQSVGLYVQALGLNFPTYGSAYLYYQNGIEGYERVPEGQPIKEGDIIVWRADFPPSRGSGHIDVASADGSFGDFTAWDQNWYPPLKLNHIRHNDNNNNYIFGYLRRNDMSTVGEIEFHDLYEAFFGPMAINQPTDGDRNRWIGAETNTVLRAMQDDPRHPAWLAYIESLKNPQVPNATQLKPGLYKV
jgi:hypothetical protein